MLWLAAGMPFSYWFWILALLGGIVAAAGAYYGQQSVRQGLVLLRVVGPGELHQRLGQGVAISGHAELERERSDPLRAGVLWQQTTHQEYRRSYEKNRSRGRWHTLSSSSTGYPFMLRVGPHRVAVRNAPTEVHGTRRRVEHQGGGDGLLSSLFGGYGRRRTIVETLHAGDVTVVGQLSCNAADGSLTLHPDEGLGMLWTGYAGGLQATIELVKGVVGVALPFAWLAGVLHYWPY